MIKGEVIGIKNDFAPNDFALSASRCYLGPDYACISGTSANPGDSFLWPQEWLTSSGSAGFG
jgi:hypothetical protein